MAHARLPEKMVETNTLGQMKPTEAGYTVPWAMSADEHGYLWLNSMYQHFPRPGGTVQMKVWRDGAGEYRVLVPRGETYRRGKRDNSCWFAIPVAELREGV